MKLLLSSKFPPVAVILSDLKFSLPLEKDYKNKE